MKSKLLGLIFGLAVFLPQPARAFSLLGQYMPSFLAHTNIYRLEGVDHDPIGAPKRLDSSYRWNVPILTYGFDQSFLDYFGSNGVAAAKQAIQILNDLPPASQLALTNYPLDAPSVNFRASAQNLLDLKSAILALLVEQMGLAEPTRHVFQLNYYGPLDPLILQFPDEALWPAGTIPLRIMEGNYDPETLLFSHSVNDTLYTGKVVAFDSELSLDTVDVVEFPVDPLATQSAVADQRRNPGEYFTGLTRDDVGGLRYLLSTNNLKYEPLLPSVLPSVAPIILGRMGKPFVDHAFRPGVNKILFVPHPVKKKTGKWLRLKYGFTDHYLSNGVLKSQKLKRVVSEPDFVFSAADLAGGRPYAPLYVRSGTSHWIFTGALEEFDRGEPVLPLGLAGPGLIQPPVNITFHKLGAVVLTDNDSSQVIERSWGSFDHSTNAPVVYPQPSPNAGMLTVHVSQTGIQETQTLQLPRLFGQWGVLQVSTNNVDWTTAAVVVYHGGVVEWRYTGETTPPRFFRLVPFNTFLQPPMLDLDEQAILIRVERERLRNQIPPGVLTSVPPTEIQPQASESPF